MFVKVLFITRYVGCQTYLDVDHAVGGQLDMREVSFAERHAVHRIPTDALNLFAHSDRTYAADR
jgi:hypothetical protein